MAINNTVQNNLSKLLKPNPKAVLPVNSAVPNLFKSLTAPQSALSNKIGGMSTQNMSVQSSPVAFQGFGGGSTNGTGTSSSFPTTSVPTTGLVKPSVQNVAVSQPDVFNKNFAQQEQTGTTPQGTPLVPTPQNNSNSNSTYQGLISSLLTAGNQAKTQQSQTSDEIATLRKNLETDTGVIQSQPQELNFQTGRINALQTQEAGKEAALQNKLAAETAANSQNIGAIGTAAGLVPDALRYGGGSNSSLNPLNNLDSIASQVINGQISPSQAQSMGGGISTWSGALNQALLQKDPQYNEGKYQGKYDANQSVTGSQAQTVAGMTSSLQQGQNLQSQLKDLISTFNINPNDINAANVGIQKIAQNTSSSQYKALENLVTDIIATYSQILTPGTTTDTARATAASLLDASAKGSSIISTLSSLDDQAKAKIAGVSTTGGSTNQNSNFSEGQKSSDGSLTYKGGKWVKS